jgi:putative aldouronate transport system permease protein
VAGTALFLIVTTLAGYVMTKTQLKGYRVFYMFFVVSMFVSGGLVPTFLLYKQLGIQNTFWVYILPGAFSTYYMILFRTYIIQLPKGLVESATIDGAGEFTIFRKIVFPLSTPILATIGLFVAVNQWNAWQDTLYYTSNPDLETLQYVLMKVLRQAEATQIAKQARSAMARTLGTTTITPDSIKMAITIVATVPILCVYPFLQKFFVKGMVLGAVKG